METRRFKLPDGRQLAWCESGASTGSVVFAFHGLPGSRLQVHPDESIALGVGARVIHVDRPGFGLSDPLPGRHLSDWPVDILRLADHLQLEQFAVAGVSGGGPFACACAALSGDRVARAALISSVGPREVMLTSKSWAVRAGFKAAAVAPWSIALPIAAGAFVGVHAPGFFLDRLFERLPSCDRDILSRPEMRAMLSGDVAEAFRNGHSAFLQDLCIEAGPWGIDFGRITCPVALWHGGRDTIVPPGATEALAALIPQATVRRYPDRGHFFVFEVWREILSYVAGINNECTTRTPS